MLHLTLVSMFRVYIRTSIFYCMCLSALTEKLHFIQDGDKLANSHFSGECGSEGLLAN